MKYFTKFEIILWSASVVLISLSFFSLNGSGVLSYVASLVGVTSLILNAKGNPVGQALMILFSVLYGVISYSFSYFGEMITYLGMTAPMAVFALVSWLRNPYKGKRSEVTVNTVSKKEVVFMIALSFAVTVIFYFVLKALGTANLYISTLSVTTSFIAAYLTFRRSVWFGLAYALNDVVLIVLWVLASINDISYVSVAVCFGVFLINDLYGCINWIQMKRRQQGQGALKDSK